MITGALRFAAPECWKAPGVYSALAGGAALRQKTPASDFVTCRGFLPGTARNVRRNLLACAEAPDSKMWRKCGDERIGSRKLLAQ
jgi:hypothetical protein